MTADEVAALLASGLTQRQANWLALMRWLLRRDGSRDNVLASPDALRLRHW